MWIPCSSQSIKTHFFHPFFFYFVVFLPFRKMMLKLSKKNSAPESWLKYTTEDSYTKWNPDCLVRRCGLVVSTLDSGAVGQQFEYSQFPYSFVKSCSSKRLVSNKTKKRSHVEERARETKNGNGRVNKKMGMRQENEMRIWSVDGGPIREWIRERTIRFKHVFFFSLMRFIVI